MENIGLFDNIQAIRKQLQFTEQGLEELHLLEDRDVETTDYTPQSPDQSPERRVIPGLRLEDLSPEVSKPRNSTPKKKALPGLISSDSLTDRLRASYSMAEEESANRPTEVKVRKSINWAGNSGPQHATETFQREADTGYLSSQGRGLSFGASNATGTQIRKVENRKDTASLEKTTAMDIQALLEEENEDLRGKLQNLRKSNSELITCNHKLLNELETNGHQLQQTRLKMKQLTADMDILKEMMSSLEDETNTIRDDRDRQQRALLEAEERSEEYKQQMSDLEAVADEYDQRVASMKAQLMAARREVEQTAKLKHKAETDREIALRSAEDLQNTLEQYHQRAKEEVHQSKTSESQMMTTLETTSRERDQLRRHVRELNAEMEDIREELRRFAEDNHAERDSRAEQEQQNVELRTQLSQYASKIGHLQQESRGISGLRLENKDLLEQVNKYREQLDKGHQELGQVRAQLVQLHRRANLGGSDQGVSVAKQGGRPLSPGDSGLAFSLEEASTVSGQLQETLVEELRAKLEERERELQMLRARIKDQSEDANAASAGGSENASQRELVSVKDRLRDETQRSGDLETLVSRLEEDRGKHTGRILSLEEKLSNLEVKCASLEAQLGQRSSQTSSLQQEVTETSGQLNTLERELRKKSSQMSRLETQLEEKVQEVCQLVSRLTESDEELHKATARLKKAKQEVEETRRDFLQQEALATNLKELHGQQGREMGAQIKALREKLAEKKRGLEEADHVVNQARQDLNAREAALADTTAELRRQQEQSRAALERVSRQSEQASERVRQLEGALDVCKVELHRGLQQIEESRTQHDQQVTELEEDLAAAKDSIATSQTSVVRLEADLEHKQKRLDESLERVRELEESQRLTTDQMVTLEQQLQRERGQIEHHTDTLRAELQRMEHKLEQACSALEQKEREVTQAKRQYSELEAVAGGLRERVADQETVMEQGHRELMEVEQKVTHVEGQLRESRNNLHNKQQQVDEIQERLDKVEGDFEVTAASLANLKEELREAQDQKEHLKREKNEAEGRLAETSRLFETTLKEFKQKASDYLDLKEECREKDEELMECHHDNEKYEVALKTQQFQLQQRAAQITQLDMVLKAHKTETDQRLIRLEGALGESQREAQQRARQVCALDDRAGALQDTLRDKEMLLEQAEQTQEKQVADLKRSAATIRQLQENGERLRAQVTELEGVNTTLTEDVEAMRAEEKRLQQAVNEAQCEASLAGRQRERVAAQLQDALHSLQAKEAELQSLAEEVALMKAAEAEAESRSNSELRRLHRELEEARLDHRRQVQDAQDSLTEAVSMKADSESAYEANLIQAKDAQRHLAVKVESMRGELVQLRGELHRNQDLLCEANHAVVLKEAEIARLEAKVSGMKRAKLANSFSSRLSRNKNQDAALSDVSSASRQMAGNRETASVGPTRDLLTSSPHSPQATTAKMEVVLRRQRVRTDSDVEPAGDTLRESLPITTLTVGSGPSSFEESSKGGEKKVSFSYGGTDAGEVKVTGDGALVQMENGDQFTFNALVNQGQDQGQNDDVKRSPPRNSSPKSGESPKRFQGHVEDSRDESGLNGTLVRSYPPPGHYQDKNSDQDPASTLQMMSLSLSEISRADTVDNNFLPSDAEYDLNPVNPGNVAQTADLDSLQGMLQELNTGIQGVAAGKALPAPARGGPGRGRGGASAAAAAAPPSSRGRLFGSTAWGATDDSKGGDATTTQRKKTAVTTATIRRPLHSSPHSNRRSKAVGLAAPQTTRAGSAKQPASNLPKPTLKAAKAVGARVASETSMAKPGHVTQGRAQRSSPMFQSKSPNVSTAISHYTADQSETSFGALGDSFQSTPVGGADAPDMTVRDLDLTSDTERVADEGEGHPDPLTTTRLNTLGAAQEILEKGGFLSALEKRRHDIQRRQADLAVQLEAVDKHLQQDSD